eukprot:353388-Chlamydomonas_euryale.AAC.4
MQGAGRAAPSVPSRGQCRRPTFLHVRCGERLRCEVYAGHNSSPLQRARRHDHPLRQGEGEAMCDMCDMLPRLGLLPRCDMLPRCEVHKSRQPGACTAIPSSKSECHS